MLKAESEKARDEWIKRTWNAVIAFTQTKKQQKRSKEKGEPWTWGEGRGRGRWSSGIGKEEREDS